MTDKVKQNWIDHYGFILVAFAHMTDWHLSDSEIKVINKKIERMISNSKQSHTKEDVAQKLVEIVQRYQSLTKESNILDTLLDSCMHLKNEIFMHKKCNNKILKSSSSYGLSSHLTCNLS